MLETRNTPKYPHIPRRRQICPAARDHGSLERVRLFEAQDALPIEPLAAQRLAAFELAETRKQKRPGQDSGSRLRVLLGRLVFWRLLQCLLRTDVLRRAARCKRGHGGRPP